jgi:hypothetical protein
MPAAASTSAASAKASNSTSAKRRSAADAATSASSRAMRTIGWSLSTDQIACRIAGASAAPSPCVRTTSDITVSPNNHGPLRIAAAAALAGM